MSTEDLREKILNETLGDHTISMLSISDIYKAMDSYFEARSMELLEYMAKNEVNSEIDLAGLSSFYYKGEWITREQLFQNFL